MSNIHLRNGVLFDSNEELQFSIWLDVLKGFGFVEKWEKVKTPFIIIPALQINWTQEVQLKTKNKKTERVFTLLHDLGYTPDFKIWWTAKGKRLFVSGITRNVNPKKWFFSDDIISFVEVKANFDLHGKTDRFSIIQKIIWRLKNVFVDLVIIPDIFEDTFVPLSVMESLRYKKTSKKAAAKGKKIGDFKVDWEVRNINEFLKKQQ